MESRVEVDTVVVRITTKMRVSVESTLLSVGTAKITIEIVSVPLEPVMVLKCRTVALDVSARVWLSQ